MLLSLYLNLAWLTTSSQVTLKDLLDDPSIPLIPWADLEIKEVIGVGASGAVSAAVYTSRDINEEEIIGDVAVKELLVSPSDLEDVMDEFLYEIKLMRYV